MKLTELIHEEDLESQTEAALKVITQVKLVKFTNDNS